MWGVAEKLLKVMTVSLVNSGVGAQIVPMVSQSSGIHLKI